MKAKDGVGPASIAPEILSQFPDLNDAQRAIVGHLDGPLLVIAGPESGKTYSIVLRALNLLLLNKAQPKELVLCTFTEKAAFELRDRLSAAARKVGYKRDLSELTASTIHSFCNRVLTQHRHRTELGHSYDTLDELTVDSDGSRPRFRDDLARHSDLMSLTVPR